MYIPMFCNMSLKDDNFKALYWLLCKRVHLNERKQIHIFKELTPVEKIGIDDNDKLSLSSTPTFSTKLLSLERNPFTLNTEMYRMNLFHPPSNNFNSGSVQFTTLNIASAL